MEMIMGMMMGVLPYLFAGGVVFLVAAFIVAMFVKLVKNFQGSPRLVPTR